MITNKRLFYSGTAMLAAFVAILIVMFMPVFNGQNGLNYLDALYNSISKGSAYYIPKMQQAVKPFAGRRIEATPDDAFAPGGPTDRCPFKKIRCPG